MKFTLFSQLSNEVYWKQSPFFVNKKADKQTGSIQSIKLPIPKFLTVYTGILKENLSTKNEKNKYQIYK